MKLDILNPTKAIISESSKEEMDLLIELLTYTNTANAHMLKRHSKNRYWMISNRITWEAKYEELKKSVKQTLIFEEDGQKYIRPGSIPYIKDKINLEITNNIEYPTPKKVAWNKLLPFDLHPYQQESVDKLIEAKHGNVELCTGSGKSAISLKICRETGFRAAIVAPSKSIFNELVEKFEHHLGKGNVGKFGSGKKILDKRFTICIGDSLVNVQKDSKEWKFFSNLNMLLVDESHFWGADTLENVCNGIFSKVPYRFFLSGTQTRGDGGEKLLQSMIGQTVHTLTTKQAVDGSYICPHEFKIIEIESSNPNYNVDDPLGMKRIHFLRNKNIAQFIAKLAVAEAARNRQTLVLVEELNQISMLMKLLKNSNISAVYAHSDSSKERLKEIGLEKVNSSESVEKFNKREAMILIGTSCIATGTNIYPTHSTVNWVGGTSEIKTKQGAVGRSVRLGKHNPWHENCTEKTKAIIYDFNVFDVYLMTKQLEDRIEYYKESGSEIKTYKIS